jgi:hypothetical protein
MRFKSLCSLGLMTAIGGPLCAGWKITTLTTTATGRRTTVTEYFQGDLRRTESQPGTPVGVIDFKNRRQIIWDVSARQYMVRRLRAGPSLAAQSSATLVVNVETIDTGERRSMFGRTARHVITKRRDGDGASALRIDGWYVDADSLPRYKRSGGISFLHVGGASVPAVKVNRQGPAETGLAIWEKTAENTIEVTELFEGELEKSVFDPPPGFQRVLQLPNAYSPSWDEQFRLRWEWFQDWLRNLAE